MAPIWPPGRLLGLPGPSLGLPRGVFLDTVFLIDFLMPFFVKNGSKMAGGPTTKDLYGQALEPESPRFFIEMSVSLSLLLSLPLSLSLFALLLVTCVSASVSASVSVSLSSLAVSVSVSVSCCLSLSVSLSICLLKALEISNFRFCV